MLRPLCDESGAFRNPHAVATVWAMATYRELLERVRADIEQVNASDAARLLDSGEAQLVVDVRERDEWDEGHLPGAVHIPRGSLESRIERAAPDRATPIVVYCATGARSAFATKSLEELGYESVVNLDGGIVDWKRSGLPVVVSESLGPAQRSRYSRHLLIPEVGEEGQLRLLGSRILLIGAGGLGSPAALYLAAAGAARWGSSTTTLSTRATSAADRPLDRAAG